MANNDADRVPNLVYCDFNGFVDDNCYRLSGRGTEATLSRLGLTLQSGMVLAVYSDDGDEVGQSDPLMAFGVVSYREPWGWVITIDNRTYCHASDVVQQSG